MHVSVEAVCLLTILLLIQAAATEGLLLQWLHDAMAPMASLTATANDDDACDMLLLYMLAQYCDLFDSAEVHGAAVVYCTTLVDILE